MRTIDTMVIGRETYETVLPFETWPYDGKRVVVLTHRPLASRYGEITYAGELAPLAMQLASEGVRRVYLDGGAAIRQGLDADVVDDMTISLVPRTIGTGRRLFREGLPGTTSWDTTGVQHYPDRIVQVHYQRAQEAPPLAGNVTLGS
jgi:dihydrofolate reductase